MKVSIVTISFNQVKFIERAICSVLSQDYPDIEYIVVDPGSTDGSLDIISQYKNRITKVIVEPDKGPPDGLNKGFAVASGDIFAYINADDALLPGAVSAAVKVFKSKPLADVVIGHGYIVDPQEKVIRRFISAPFNAWRFAYGAATVIQQSTFFRNSIYSTVGGFNINNRTSWDAELLLNMGLKGAKIRIVNDYWSIFTIHPDSISGSQRMAEESLMNHRRYFKMVMGREPNRGDYWWRKIAWIQRWLMNPIGGGQYLADKLFGPPTLGYTLKKTCRKQNI
jgi:glycosyltransferase involved in cell wall biosynthesis